MNATKQRVSTTGKTLDLAIVKAAVALGVDQNQVAYEVTKESKGGIMKLFGFGQVEISAWVKGHGGRGGRDGHQEAGHEARGDGGRRRRGGRNRGRGRGRDQERDPSQERAGASVQGEGRRGDEGRSRHGRRSGGDRGENRERAPRAERAPREPVAPLEPVQLESVMEELREFCAEICSRIAGTPVEVKASLQGDRLRMDINSDAISQMLSENSKLAEALEHLLRKKPRHLKQELPFRVFIDAGNSRRGREEELATVAREMAEKVVETQRPVVLNYQSSYDRRIIHTTLESDERVFTKSIGSGSNRKLMVLPARDKRMSDSEALSAAESEENLDR
ncbi:protein jag [bacterium]|nr:protein jag [bacterium]